MKYRTRIRMVSMIGLFSVSILSYSSEITDTYNTGDTLTAVTLTNIKNAVNDNNTRISALEGSNVLVVATSNGDFNSVATAIASITNASSTNPYLVRVMPGIYTETNLVQVQSFVHLQGSGPETTIITSTRTDSVQGPGAATLQLDDSARVSNITVRNEGTGVYGIALYSAVTTNSTVVDNVYAQAIGSGGTGHFAAYWNDANATIRNSQLYASGAVGFGTGVNAAFGSVNNLGGFPQALIENSVLLGGANSLIESCNDSSGTGYGLFLSNSSPKVKSSYICGGHRGISVQINGNMTVQHSTIATSSNGSAFLFEVTASGSIKVATSAVSYFGSNKFTGAGTSGLTCVGVYNWGTYASLTDAVNSATACN